MDIKADGTNVSCTLYEERANAGFFESTFRGRRSVVKQFYMADRPPELEAKLTLKLLDLEASCMREAKKLGVCVQELYYVDRTQHNLTFEHVEGSSVHNTLLKFASEGVEEDQLNDIAMQIGCTIAKLHDGGIVHGYFIPQNMLIRADTNQLVPLDFSLSSNILISTEDKAFELYKLERAFLDSYPPCVNVMDRILAAYRGCSKQWSSTLDKLDGVRKRFPERNLVG